MNQIASKPAAPDTEAMTVLVVGATGSIGRLVVAEALARRHHVRALVRNARRAASLPNAAERVTGDLTREASLAAAVEGIDAIVFTHGTASPSRSEAEQVDYGAVRNVLSALGGRPVRIALMSSIGVTNRQGEYNRSTEVHDWKRRGERLVRASGMPYTIVRPGWFDYNAPDQHQLSFLQGDRRWAGTPEDGVVSRRQIAEVLVSSLSCPEARGKTFELVAERGLAPGALAPLFAALEADVTGSLDGVHDTANQPLSLEPARVREDLRLLSRNAAI